MSEYHVRVELIATRTNFQLRELYREHDPNFEPIRAGEDLESRPERLIIATRNNVGRYVGDLIEALGFRPTLLLPGSQEGDLMLATAPEQLMGRDWGISYQDKEQDPNLFTIFLKHAGGIGYLELLRQSRNPEGQYFVFFH